MNKGLSRRRIVLNGQDIEYELQRKQVKNNDCFVLSLS